MTPYTIYRLYLAIKLHFTVKSYDVFVNNGSIRGPSEEEFNKKGLRYRFNVLSNQLSSKRDAIEYFVSCYAYGVDVFNSDDADASYAKWKKHKEMTTQLILDDIDQLNLPADISGTTCKLQSLISGKSINIETGVALNNKYKFADEWVKSNFVYAELGSKIMKLTKFVKFNEDKVNKFISNHEHQETTTI